MKRYFLFCISVIMFTIVLHAQTDDNCLGEAIVTCPAEYVPNQKFAYEISIPSKGFFTAIPNFGKLTCINGPTQSTRHTTSTQNGHITETDTISFKWEVITYYEGDYKIPSFRVRKRDDNKYYTVPSHTINISKNAKILDDEAKSTSIVEQSENYADDIVLQWNIMNKGAICVGNEADCSLELLFRSNISQVSDYNFPIPKNVYITPIETDGAITPTDTLIGNEKYRHCILKRYKITPLSAGNLVLPEASATLDVYKSSGDFFEDFFNVGGKSEKKVVKTKATTIKIKKGNLSDISSVAIENNGLLVCCDVSGSMQIVDFKTKRSIVSKQIVEEIMSKLPTDTSVNFMAFAGGVEQECSDDIMQYLDTITTPKKDGTALYDAILYPLATQQACKDIILLTDGLDNCSHVGIETAMDILKQHDIRLHVIYLNSMADSVDVNMYMHPDTLEDGTVSEGYYILQRFPNEKLSENQISVWKRKLVSLGGQFYIIKKEDDIQSVVDNIIKNISVDTNTSSTKYSQEQINRNNYILNRLRKDIEN